MGSCGTDYMYSILPWQIGLMIYEMLIEIEIFNILKLCLPAVGYWWTIVQQNSDVDAHDGNNAAAVEVHHVESLECEGGNLVVHHLYQTEGKHEED